MPETAGKEQSLSDRLIRAQSCLKKKKGLNQAATYTAKAVPNAPEFPLAFQPLHHNQILHTQL